MEYFLLDLLVLGCINAIMVVGLNLQFGYAGLINATFYTFTAVGAYVAAITTMGAPPTDLGFEAYILQWSLPWPVGFLLAGVVAAVLGVAMLSVAFRGLRMEYLAIVTIAIGFILWNLLSNDVGLVDGSNGLFGISYVFNGAQISATGYSLEMLGLAAAILVGCIGVSRRIFRSPFGRVLRAMREDEAVAETFGKDVRIAKLWVFAIGCFMAGISGALFVYYLHAWSPATFLPIESFVLIAAMIIGGNGNYWGAVFASFVILEGLNELARFLPDFGNPNLLGAGREILIGLVLILILRFRPEGLIPERRLRWYGAKRGLSGWGGGISGLRAALRRGVG